MKRSLLMGIEELEHVWKLKPQLPKERFRKDGRGKWIVDFERGARRRLLQPIDGLSEYGSSSPAGIESCVRPLCQKDFPGRSK